MTRKRLDRELKNITQQLIQKYKPEKIILFGSMLDENKPTNDIDLLIVKKTKLSRLGKRANEAREFLEDKSIPVDFLVYTPEEVQHELKRGNVFMEEILKKGRLLYEEQI